MKNNVYNGQNGIFIVVEVEVEVEVECGKSLLRSMRTGKRNMKRESSLPFTPRRLSVRTRARSQIDINNNETKFTHSYSSLILFCVVFLSGRCGGCCCCCCSCSCFLVISRVETRKINIIRSQLIRHIESEYHYAVRSLLFIYFMDFVKPCLINAIFSAVCVYCLSMDMIKSKCA